MPAGSGRRGCGAAMGRPPGVALRGIAGSGFCDESVYVTGGEARVVDGGVGRSWMDRSWTDL